MNTQFLRYLAILVILLVILPLPMLPSAALPAAALQAEAPDESASNNDDIHKLELLARSLHLPVEQLQLGDQALITLANGKQLLKVKAIDLITDEIVGAVFDGERMVDENDARQRAYDQWRAAHGALTYDLIQQLASASPVERFTVAVWLKAEIEPLPKPVDNPSPASQDATIATTSGEGAAPVADPTTPAAAEPIPFDQLPVEVQQALLEAESQPQAAPPTEYRKPDQAEAPAMSTVEQQQQAEQQQAFNRQNAEHLRAQIAPLSASFTRQMQALGYQVQYASETTPLVFLTGLTRQQVEELALHPEVDAIYDASLPGGPALEVARVTQNADLLETWGNYTGNGIDVAIVEGERVIETNPYLNVDGRRDNTKTPKSHPTGVAGIVASTHSTRRGLAPNADIFSANGDDYTTIAALQAAMDWGSSNAVILNNSFWAAECGQSSSLSTIDRHMDYIVRYNYDFSAVASGNFKVSGCGGSSPAPYVSSPSKGYNMLTVGNFDDKNTNTWSDDTMRSSSQYNDSGRFKPEATGSGTDINSTTTSSPWTGGIGSGTSYASPMVAALAANMLQANSSLISKPEAVTAVILATALHNIEGDARLSRADGVGAIVGTAALASVERGHWNSQFISSATSFPIQFSQSAHKGERVRFVIRWLSNPNASYTTDVLPADLDLRAYRADGTTLVASSLNSATNFEIVDFVAPASETYVFKVSLSGSWVSGASGTWLGAGWWRGVYRILPDAGYYDPQATPLGTHLAVLPSDFSPSIYWRAFGIRPNGSNDHDLRLYSASWFDDPNLRNQLKASTYGTGSVDFVVVDGNHWSSSAMEHYHVRHYSGSGGYDINWSNLGQGLFQPGVYGPFTISSSQVVKVFDVFFYANQPRQVTIIPAAANAADLAVELFKSSSGTPATHYSSRGYGVVLSDASTSPAYKEKISYESTESDWLGLVVFSKQSAYAQFYIYISHAAYLPAIMR